MLPVQHQLDTFARVDTAVTLLVLFPLAVGVLVIAHAIWSHVCNKRCGFVYPTPRSTLPVLGNTLDVMVHHDRVYDWFLDECLASDRPWLLNVMGSVPAVIVSTPEHFEDVLKTHFDAFNREEEGTGYAADLFGKGILASDGDAWYFHRKTASNLFSHQMIRDVMYEAVRDKTARFVAALEVYEARREPVSFKAVIAHFTSDVFGKIGFGVDLHCIENGVAGKPGNEFIEAFGEAARALQLRYLQPVWFWRLKRFLNVGSERRSAQSLRVINSFIYRIIEESMRAKKRADVARATAAGIDSPPPKDLISLFLSSTIKADKHIKAKAFDSEMHLIRDTIVNFIFAGKDTTSHSMSFFIVAMNRYPNVLEKVREELRAKLPGLMSGKLAIPSMDDLTQLTYLEAVIRENLRLNTLVPLVPRQAKTDLVLSDGTAIAKGSRVTLAMYAANRRKEVWGEDALEFKPERWIDPATGKLVTMSPFKAISFLAGPRQCIGMKLAMMELKCTLAVLASRFDFKTVEDPWSITYEAAVTMNVRGPLLVSVSALRGEERGRSTSSSGESRVY